MFSTMGRSVREPESLEFRPLFVGKGVREGGRVGWLLLVVGVVHTSTVCFTEMFLGPSAVTVECSLL